MLTLNLDRNYCYKKERGVYIIYHHSIPLLEFSSTFYTLQYSVHNLKLHNMAFSAKQSYANSTLSHHLQQQKFFSSTNSQLSSFPINLSFKNSDSPNLSSQKPLHISPLRDFNFFDDSKDLNPQQPLIQCNAYKAHQSQPLEINIKFDEQAASQKLKIGVYFATWWALNVIFNIYNKKVLNAFPFPWLTSTLSLAAGSLMMLISWAFKIVEAPETDSEFWKTLLPVSVENDDFKFSGS